MKKTDSDIQKNLFTGSCSVCGELYEASSAVDDLEGLNFSCKKLMCGGRIELRPSEIIGSRVELPGDSFSEKNAASRRYC